MTTRSDLQAALQNQNCAAWLMVIREGESSADPSAYTIVNGGGHFAAPPWVHPYAGQSAPPGLAAGAYQYIPHSWQRVAEQYGFPDFSPQCQDEGAIALTVGRGALDDVISGDLATAMHKCSQEWTSLADMPLRRAMTVWQAYGGKLMGSQMSGAQPQQMQQAQSAPTIGSNPMGALALIAQLIPQIASLIKPGSTSTARDASVAQTVLNTVVQAAGIVTDGSPATTASVGAAVDKMNADPELAKQVQRAVVTEPSIMQILEIGQGGITSARAANAVLATQPDGRWWIPLCQPVFVISLLFSAVIIMIVGNMLGMYWGGSFSDWDTNTRSNVIFSIISGTLGTLGGYWFGTTVQSAKKDQVIAAQAGQSSNG